VGSACWNFDPNAEAIVMNVLEHIRGQIGAVDLPLYAITLTAVPCPDTPLLLMLHWHAFRRDFLLDEAQARPVAFRPVPTSALQLNERWTAVETIDLAAMEAAWEMGAWDVTREWRPSCIRPGADNSEALDCMRAFGSYPESMGGRDLVIAEAPDCDELLELGARVGYLTWKFRPVAGGIWAEIADDATLNEDGSRDPTCPLLPQSSSTDGRTTYRFGRSGRPVLH
jgi:hypothetical protein